MPKGDTMCKNITAGEARRILDKYEAEHGLKGTLESDPLIPRDVAAFTLRAALEGKADGELIRTQIGNNIRREFGR
jgi:hypothetical protein